MIKQREKNSEKLQQLIWCIVAIIVLIVLSMFMIEIVKAVIFNIQKNGSGIIYYTYLYIPYVSTIAISIIIMILCIGTIYDTIIYPKKAKEITEILKTNGKVRIKIGMISKKNPKKDSDLWQAYKVEWKFIDKSIKQIQTETIFYTDEPDFMFKYRDKEAYIEYDDKYMYKYKLNFGE